MNDLGKNISCLHQSNQNACIDTRNDNNHIKCLQNAVTS